MQISAKFRNPLVGWLKSVSVLFVLVAGSTLAGASDGAGKIQTLAFFSGLNGSSPLAGVIFAADGCIYGTTSQGGVNGPPFAGYGTLYRITPAGNLTTLVSFNNTDGAKPASALVQVSDGSLFGTTLQGGSANLGVLYRITTNGNYSALGSFTGGNGSNPSGRLLLGWDGLLYGTTQSGGASNLGTIFRTTTNGTLTTVLSFNGTNGANPFAGLIQGQDGHLYGTTVNGGNLNKGTVFRLTTNGVFTNLVSFNTTNGNFPYGGLIQYTDGHLYGTTAYGGTENLGTIYRISTNGNLTTLYSFEGRKDGANPWASLLRGRDGNLYGTTILGGSVAGAGWGTIFQVKTNGAFVPLAAFLVNSNGISPYCELTQDSSGQIYGTTSSLGIGLKGTVFQLVPAAAALRTTSQANSIQVTWDAWPGLSYQIQFKTNSTQLEWNDLGAPMVATNGVLTGTDVISGAARYYRIKRLSAP